jgi:hypothetical protein
MNAHAHMTTLRSEAREEFVRQRLMVKAKNMVVATTESFGTTPDTNRLYVTRLT